MGLGATVCHPPSSTGTLWSAYPTPKHPVEPLRPEWLSCTAATAPAAFTPSTIQRHASTWSSFHRPTSHGEMRPSGETAVASAMIMPKPPIARDT